MADGSGDGESSVAETDQEQATHGSGGEERGAPGPTFWPIAFALGIALVLIGVVLNWVVFGIGIGVAAVAAMGWIYESTRRLRRSERAGNAGCGGTGRG